MTALKTLQDRGQSIWLGSISRELLESGSLYRGKRRRRDGRQGGHRRRCARDQAPGRGRDSFVQSWNDLLACIESTRKTMRAA